MVEGDRLMKPSEILQTVFLVLFGVLTLLVAVGGAFLAAIIQLIK